MSNKAVRGNITLTLYGGTRLPEVVLGGRITLAVDDINAAYEEMKQKGVHILKTPGWRNASSLPTHSTSRA